MKYNLKVKRQQKQEAREQSHRKDAHCSEAHKTNIDHRNTQKRRALSSSEDEIFPGKKNEERKKRGTGKKCEESPRKRLLRTRFIKDDLVFSSDDSCHEAQRFRALQVSFLKK